MASEKANMKPEVESTEPKKPTASILPYWREVFTCNHCFAILPTKIYSHSCPDKNAKEIEKAPVTNVRHHSIFIQSILEKNKNN